MKAATRALRALTALAVLIAGLTLAPPPSAGATATCEEDPLTQLADLATFRVRTTVKRADGTLAPARTTGALPLGLAVVPTDRGGLLHVTLTPPVLPPDGTIAPATATVTKLLPLGGLPVRVEILVDLPCGATVAFGYDGTESRAPAVSSASVAFSSGTITTGDVDLTTLAPGPNLTTIAALHLPGASDTTASLRLAPVPTRFGMAFRADESNHRTLVEVSSTLPTTATATVDDIRPGRTVHADATVAGLPGGTSAPVTIDVTADPAGHVDVRYAAPQRIASVDVNATVDENGDEVTLDGLVEDVPTGFTAVADLPQGGTPTVTWVATDRLGHLDATVNATPAEGTRSQARLDVVGLPPQLTLTGITTDGELTGAEVTLDQPVERIEVGFAKGQDVVLGTDRPDIVPYVRHDADIVEGSSSVAARLVGVTHARVDTADPVAVDISMTPGDLRLLVQRPGELTLGGVVTAFPGRLNFEFSPSSRTLTNLSSGPVGRIDVVADASAPLFGRVRHVELDVHGVPADLTLTIGAPSLPDPSTQIVIDEPPVDCLPTDIDCGSEDDDGGDDSGSGDDGNGDDSGSDDPEPTLLLSLEAHGEQIGELSVVLASSAEDVALLPEDGFRMVDTLAAFSIHAHVHGLQSAEVRTGSFRGPSDTLKIVELALDAPRPAGASFVPPLAVDVQSELTRTRIDVADRPDSITSLRLDRNVVFLTDPEDGIVEAPVAQRLHYEASGPGGRTTLTSRPVRDDDVVSQAGLSLVADSLPATMDFCFASSRRCTNIAIDDAIRSLTFTAAAPVHLTLTACDALRCQPCLTCDPDTQTGKFVHVAVTAQVVRAQLAPPVREPVNGEGHLFLDTDGLPLTGTFSLHDPSGESLRDLTIALPAGDADGDPPSFNAEDWLIRFEVNPLNETDGAVNVTSDSGSITCPAGTVARIRVRVKIVAIFTVIGANLQDTLCLGEQR